MFAKAFSFGYATRLFPQLTGGATIVGVTLLLFRNYLPGALGDFVKSSVNVFQQDMEQMEDDGEGKGEPRAADRPLSGSSVAIIGVVSYVVLSLLVGMLWITPLFVAGYLIWFRISWRYVAVLTVLSFLLAYGFMEILGIQITSGYLLNVGGS